MEYIELIGEVYYSPMTGKSYGVVNINKNGSGYRTVELTRFVAELLNRWQVTQELTVNSWVQINEFFDTDVQSIYNNNCRRLSKEKVAFGYLNAQDVIIV